MTEKLTKELEQIFKKGEAPKFENYYLKRVYSKEITIRLENLSNNASPMRPTPNMMTAQDRINRNRKTQSALRKYIAQVEAEHDSDPQRVRESLRFFDNDKIKTPEEIEELVSKIVQDARAKLKEIQTTRNQK